MQATMDADLVVDLRLDQAAPFSQAMGTGFYADLEMMRDAIRQRSSFNLVHLDIMFKVDLFVARERDSTASSWPGASCTC